MMLVQIIATFFATLSFSVLFDIPHKEMFFCGIAGAFGWFIYLSIVYLNSSIIVATFFSAVGITFISRVFAAIRKVPVTVFLISGIIPLVPGSGIYNTMYGLINGDIYSATIKGLETFKIAGVIAVGIMVVLSLPQIRIRNLRF